MSSNFLLSTLGQKVPSLCPTESPDILFVTLVTSDDAVPTTTPFRLSSPSLVQQDGGERIVKERSWAIPDSDGPFVDRFLLTVILRWGRSVSDNIFLPEPRLSSTELMVVSTLPILLGSPVAGLW